MFAEPSVMAAFLLPPLLHMAEKYPACPALAERLRAWASRTAPRVLEDLAACRALRPGGCGPRGRAEVHLLKNVEMGFSI